jgi:cytochrome c oxidase subunit 1
MLNETMGKIHFYLSFIFMNGIFWPMLIQGLAGVSRRLADGGASYAHAQEFLHWNVVMSYSAWLLAIAQIPFIYNLIKTLLADKGSDPDPNPWNATTVEWTDTTSPPLGHGNFEKAPVVHRGPYEYSVPGESTDFTPQTQS